MNEKEMKKLKFQLCSGIILYAELWLLSDGQNTIVALFRGEREKELEEIRSKQTDQIQPDYVFTLLGNRQEIALLSSCL